MFAPAAHQQAHAARQHTAGMQQLRNTAANQLLLEPFSSAVCSNKQLPRKQNVRRQLLPAAALSSNCSSTSQLQQLQPALLRPCQPTAGAFSSTDKSRRRLSAPLRAASQQKQPAAIGVGSISSSGQQRKQRCSIQCGVWGKGRSSSSSSSAQTPDPWQQQQPPSDWNGASPSGLRFNGSGTHTSTSTTPLSSIDGANGSSRGPVNPLENYDPWDDARPRNGPVDGVPQYEQTDWGWDGADQDWDPAAGLAPEQLADIERDYLEQMEERRRTDNGPPRDKWITPLLDWQSIYGAFDPDQSRTEDAMADEALTNKEESREALSFTGRLVVIPLLTGAIISHAITEPVLSFSLQNNPNAFAMTERQKIEGAAAVHLEETRVRMMIAIGQAPPLDDAGMLRHLHEYALEVQEEERRRNESHLMTLVSDSISAMVFFAMFARDTQGRTALFNTLGRLFAGLSDIAKAVLIILVADTLLGYHSEEGWTGFLDLFLGHYGFEMEEESILLFVGIIPIAIDVWFKYWIFIGLNRISPGAVVTIRQLDRH